MKHVYIYFLTTCLIKIGCKQSRYRRYIHQAKQESYRVPIKVAPEKKVFGHFLLLDGSIWTETMLYDQGISLRRSGYPTCLYSEKKCPPAPSRWPFGRSAGRFRATGPDFGPKIRFFAIAPRILSMARL